MRSTDHLCTHTKSLENRRAELTFCLKFDKTLKNCLRYFSRYDRLVKYSIRSLG